MLLLLLHLLFVALVSCFLGWLVAKVGNSKKPWTALPMLFLFVAGFVTLGFAGMDGTVPLLRAPGFDWMYYSVIVGFGATFLMMGVCLIILMTTSRNAEQN